MTPLIRRAAIRLDLVARGQHGLAALEQIFRRIVHGARSSRSSIPLFATVAVLLGLAGVSAQDAATPNATLSGFHGVNQRAPTKVNSATSSSRSTTTGTKRSRPSARSMLLLASWSSIAPC
jgi:hypothetical protein